jgi:hypothetical protein
MSDCKICNDPANPFIGTCPHGGVKEMSEELKVCPWCGSIPEVSSYMGAERIICNSRDCFPKSALFRPAWNSAWCHKEIEKLKESIRIKDEALSKLISRMDDGTLVRDVSRDHEENWHLRMIELVKDLAFVKEALKGGSHEE